MIKSKRYPHKINDYPTKQTITFETVRYNHKNKKPFWEWLRDGLFHSKYYKWDRQCLFSRLYDSLEHNNKAADLRSKSVALSGGDEGDRTPYLLNAIQALFQHIGFELPNTIFDVYTIKTLRSLTDLRAFEKRIIAQLTTFMESLSNNLTQR